MDRAPTLTAEQVELQAAMKEYRQTRRQHRKLLRIADELQACEAALKVSQERVLAALDAMTDDEGD